MLYFLEGIWGIILVSQSVVFYEGILRNNMDECDLQITRQYEFALIKHHYVLFLSITR
jgi:hypothetical protein